MWTNVSDKDLITASCDRQNWIDNEFMLTIRARLDANETFFDPLYDAQAKAGIDSVAFGNALNEAINNTKVVSPVAELLSAAAIKEQETEWLIPGYIPRYQITVLAGDGGSGKTTIECALAASVSTGNPCFMSQDIPFKADPENVLFLSSEDDFSRILNRKLRVVGADLEKVFTIPIASDMFTRIKFGSADLKQIIEAVKPGLVIFDPIQAFVPPDIQMGWRNAMRQCLNPLIGLGETYGATFIIVCHTNKQTGISGRRRIAESADIWDIARSVLMVGDTGEGNLKYLTHEKSNYGELQRTILYSLDSERVMLRGYSDLKDADYVRNDRLPRSAPARNEAKELIIETLKSNGGSMKADDLDNTIKGQGVSLGTLKRAKTELKQGGTIRYSKERFSDKWQVSFVQVENDSDHMEIPYI